MFRRKKTPAQQAPTKLTQQAAALQPAQHQAKVPPRAPTLRRPLTIGECLEQLQGTLRRLRTLNPGDLQAFPLLNEAQRRSERACCPSVPHTLHASQSWNLSPAPPRYAQCNS